MTSIAKILGEKVPRENLVERIRFHFEKIFQKDWEERKLEDLI